MRWYHQVAIWIYTLSVIGFYYRGYYDGYKESLMRHKPTRAEEKFYGNQSNKR